MPLNIDTVGSVRVVTLEGKLATEVSQQLKTEFDELIDRSPGPMLLDMSSVKFVSSYFVGVLVATRGRLAEQRMPLHLAGLDPRHRLVLRISALEGLFNYHATREDGIAALEAGQASNGA